MLEKFGHISNPLTIIAIFAGLAEVSGTLVLPFLSESVQSTYVWFLMFFPTLLVVLFFSVLYKKHKVLYAPSDYRSDNSFLRLLEDDFEEDKDLFVADVVKENIENISSNVIQDRSEIDKVAESISTKVRSYTWSQQKSYYLEAFSFERQIADILVGLGVKIDPEYNGIDILAYKKDGKPIPIEIKYYNTSLRSVSITSNLVNRIREFMANLNTDEAIIIISSSISCEGMNIIRKLSPENEIHIVTGNTANLLVPQLKKIFN